jgi:probable phosphoglycerate mutase
MPSELPGRGRRLLLVRHGRTAWNAEGRAQGHADVGLDDLGRAQSELMAATVAELEPALLVTSDLRRARETAAFLEKETGLTAQEDPRLREYDLGARTGLTLAEFGERMGADVDAWWDVHAHIEVPGAESSQEVHDRIVPALAEILDRLGPDQTGVVVLHGAALRIGLAGLLGWPIEAANGLEAMRNCAWATLVEDGASRLRLSAYNTVAPAPPGTPEALEDPFPPD